VDFSLDLSATFPRIAILTAIFIGVVATALAVILWSSNRAAVQRRLLDTRDTRIATPETTLRADRSRGAWVRLINAIEQSGLSLVDTRSTQLRTKLIAAGYRAPEAPRLFTLLRLVLTLGLPSAYLLICLWRGSSPSILTLYFTGSILAVLGLYLPNLWISARASRRQQALINGFPDGLDLMLVCVEAGLGMEAAFARVGSEMARSHPLLADVIATVVLELRAGRSREEALRRMADRAGVDEIRSFSTLLIQSDKLGSSIAQTLRVYAAEMRERRRMRAEEKAHRLPVLLSIPLVVCMLPVMIGVLMLPAIIRVIRTLVPAMGG
jgi:tight adherence protein C